MSDLAFSDRYRRIFEDPSVRDAVADHRIVHLAASVPPWSDSGLEVREGEEITILAEGRVVLSKELDLWGPPRFHLWGRIGLDGTIFKGPREAFTVRADRSGPLHLGILQGEWATPGGKLATPREVYRELEGGIDVVAIRWQQDALRGLPVLLEAEPRDPLLGTALRAIEAPVRRPEGWSPLWFLGETDIFSESRQDGQTVISVEAENDLGIVRKPVSFPLAASTRIFWDWRMKELPATEAENQFATHDYVSIGCEFDNGRDLTWYWSSRLPEGRIYHCPLPAWRDRETHVVVRSGHAGLGTWSAEGRNVWEDYMAGVGGEAPTEITAVWLIAVSLFRHGRGVAEFREIALANEDKRLAVL